MKLLLSVCHCYKHNIKAYGELHNTVNPNNEKYTTEHIII